MQSTKEILMNLNPKKDYKKLLMLWGGISVFVIVCIALVYWWKTREPKKRVIVLCTTLESCDF